MRDCGLHRNKAKTKGRVKWYTHVTNEMQEDAAQRMGSIMAQTV